MSFDNYCHTRMKYNNNNFVVGIAQLRLCMNNYASYIQKKIQNKMVDRKQLDQYATKLFTYSLKTNVNSTFILSVISKRCRCIVFVRVYNLELLPWERFYIMDISIL